MCGCAQEFSVANPKSMYTRSVLRFGGPREGFDNIVDNEDEQGKEVGVGVGEGVGVDAAS